MHLENAENLLHLQVGIHYLDLGLCDAQPLCGFLFLSLRSLY